jgi:hypothetical protein
MRELNELISRLTPRQFEDFVFDVLMASMKNAKFQRELRLGPIRIDIVVNPLDEPPGAGIAFEVRKAAILSVDVVLAQIGRRESIQKEHQTYKFILVIGGDLTEAAATVAAEHNLTIWGAEELEARLNDKVREKWFGAAAQERDEHPPKPSRAEALIETLQAIPPSGDGMEFQQWVSDAMEYLFVPPLGPMHYEDYDSEKRNRRDIILENWALDGFWAQIRTIYTADQIIVDAKNYGKEIRKEPIVDLAHYLKPYGCGLFGMICCRMGSHEAATHAIREQWIGGKKMIVALSDEVMTQMIQRKAVGKAPEELLRHEIAQFRKSL